MIITMNTKGTICLFWFCYFFLYNDVKLSFCISNQRMVHSLGEGCKLCRCQRGRLGLGWVGEKGVTRFLAAAINLGGNTPTHFALTCCIVTASYLLSQAPTSPVFDLPCWLSMMASNNKKHSCIHKIRSYRVFFSTGPPLKKFKYGKIRLGEVRCF